MDVSLENNYSNVCRTCLAKRASISVFGTQDTEENTISLGEMLMSCTSIKIIEEDELPKTICLNCSELLNSAYTFRKLCEKSDTTLREYMSIFSSINPETKFSMKISAIDSSYNNLSTKTTVKDDHTEEKYSICDNKTEEQLKDFVNVSINETINKTTECDKTKRRYICKKCNEICFGLVSYRWHMSEIHGEIYTCNLCNKNFNAKNILARHILTNHNSSSETCTKPYKSKTGIIKTHNLPRTCDICHKTFRCHSNLERHKLTHTGEKPCLCNVCGKGFAQMSYLKIHYFIHTGEKPYKCQMCSTSFTAPGTLMTHIRTHTGERPHICKICGKDFPQSGYLATHIRTHTGEKPLECKVCNRRFNQSSRLKIHMRIHSGEKPYQCKECGRSFAVKGSLKKHLRTHTGERPYVCTICTMCFAQSGTLATHMKVHKPKE